MKKRKNSIITKLVAMVIALFVVINIVSGSVIYSRIKSTMDQQMKHQMKTTLQGISANIDGDALEQLIKNGGEIGQSYSELNEYLNKCLPQGAFEYLYTLGKFEDGNYYYAVDSLREDDEDFSPFGLALEGGEASGFEVEDQALSEGLAYTPIESFEDWGNILTGYVAIYNSKGEAVGLLGMDMKADDYMNQLMMLSNQVGGILIVSLIIIGLVLSFLLNKVLEPLKDVKEGILTVAQGQLNVNIAYTKEDELGDISKAFNHMSQQVKSMIEMIYTRSEQLVGHATNLVGKSSQLNHSSSAISEDALVITHTAQVAKDHMFNIKQKNDEMSEELITLKESLLQVGDYANQSYTYAKEGEVLVKDIADQITHANTITKETKVQVVGLQKEIAEANKLINSITGIAAKTRILALNASIEAERSSREEGDGFKVVAHEVGVLADQSNEVSKKIADILMVLTEENKESVTLMEDSLSKMQTTMLSTEKAVTHFEHIVEGSHRMDTNIGYITTCMENYMVKIQDIIKTIRAADQEAINLLESSQSISGVTQQQFASSEELVEWAKALQDIAKDIEEQLTVFSIE